MIIPITVDQAREHKKELEQSIKGLLILFTQLTGMTCDSVLIQSVTAQDPDGGPVVTQIYDVICDVKI